MLFWNKDSIRFVIKYEFKHSKDIKVKSKKTNGRIKREKESGRLEKLSVINWNYIIQIKTHFSFNTTSDRIALNIKEK